MCYYALMSNKKGIPVVVLTCAFAMFAVAAIPTHAKASSYYNGVDMSTCTNVYCDSYTHGDAYGESLYFDDGVGFGFNNYGQPNAYSYYPTYYYEYPAYQTYPAYTSYQYLYAPRKRPVYQNELQRDFAQGIAEWNAAYDYYRGHSL